MINSVRARLSAAQHQQQHHAYNKLRGCRQVSPSPAGTRQNGQTRTLGHLHHGVPAARAIV
jgi:hypothetical protein